MVASVYYDIKYTISLWPPKSNHCIPNINLVLTWKQVTFQGFVSLLFIAGDLFSHWNNLMVKFPRLIHRNLVLKKLIISEGQWSWTRHFCPLVM